MKKLIFFSLLLFAASCKNHKPLPQGLSPQEALKTFQLPEGFQIELVAAEPLVADPVAMEIDEKGNFYVVEMHGYPEDLKGSGVIKLLQDTDQDGAFDLEEVERGDDEKTQDGKQHFGVMQVAHGHKGGIVLGDDACAFQGDQGEEQANARRNGRLQRGRDGFHNPAPQARHGE